MPFPRCTIRVVACIIMTFFLIFGNGQDSINLDIVDLDQIDLSALGTPTLDRYQASYDVNVDETCEYSLRIDWKKNGNDTIGSAKPDFEGACVPNNGAGFAPDGEYYHAPRRYWMQFPKYVFDTTGFDHMSIYWKPCGLPPKGLRQPRYDVNFYTVIPQYRAYWVCQEFLVPRICRYNQSSFLGRGHFSLPRLERDANFLANMPLHFQPDPLQPEAYQYEGLISYDQGHEYSIPNDTASWEFPLIQMSTYDGDAVSWRALIPLSFVTDGYDNEFYATQYYVYQTLPRLPESWNVSFTSSTGIISLVLHGSAGMCGESFEQAKNKAENEDSIVIR